MLLWIAFSLKNSKQVYFRVSRRLFTTSSSSRWKTENNG